MAKAEQYPFDPRCPRRLVIAGKYKKRVRKEPAKPEGEVLMCELNPKLLTNEERGQGDSINARVHRLLHPEAR